MKIRLLCYTQSNMRDDWDLYGRIKCVIGIKRDSLLRPNVNYSTKSFIRVGQNLFWLSVKTFFSLYRLFQTFLLFIQQNTVINRPGNTKGGSITVLLTSCLTGFESAVWQLTIFVFYLQNRLFQISQTGSQWCSDTSPF